MDPETWSTQNRSAIEQRLRWLAKKPDGVLCVEPSGPHFVIVMKEGTQLRLLLVEQARPRTTITQSHLDLRDPLHLVAPYTQAAILGLLWQSQPHRIGVIGLGGGRVPLVWHHYLPEVHIECAEIDPIVVRMAAKYFGLRPDERLHVAVQDGREWLAQQDRRLPYDILFIDAFVDNDRVPHHLATVEFYDLCRTRLAQEGVLIVNLLETGPFFQKRVTSIHNVFPQVYLCPVPGENCVVFATTAPPLDQRTLVERATSVQSEHHFSFPYVEWATVVSCGRVSLSA